MGIREALNQRPGLTTGITATVIIAAIVYVIWQAVFGSDSSSDALKSAYYSIDDGKTWFVDDVSKPAPFVKDGGQAVRVHLFSVDGGKTKIPLYLEKFTDKGVLIYNSARADENDVAAMISAQERLQRELLIKRPGESKWYPRPHNDFVTQLKKAQFKDLPDGTDAVEVNPE